MEPYAVQENITEESASNIDQPEINLEGKADLSRKKQKNKQSLLYCTFFRVLFYVCTVCCGVGAAGCLSYYYAETYYYGVYDYGALYVGGSILVGAAFLFALLSAVVTGRNRKSREIHEYHIDRIPGEIEIGIVGLLLLINVGMVHRKIEHIYDLEIFWVGAVFATILTLILMPVMMIFYLSVIRQIKGKSKRWLCYRFSTQIQNFCLKVWEKIKVLWKELTDDSRFKKYSFQRQMFLRQSIYAGSVFGFLALLFIVALTGATGGVCLLLLIGISVYIPMTLWYVRGYNQVNETIGKLAEQIDEVQKGNLGYSPKIPVYSPLFETSRKLAGISNGLQKSVEDRIKSERMKIELVTNVSHDLKTPLTSIISYVDLLSKDETLSPEARDYVMILNQKSYRLKNIVSDLFDLAKATSGSSELVQEELDMSKLAVQTLADMSDRIEESGQIVKTNITDPPVPIFTDGKKMYRVFQNVIDNALKYSMKGTRIFIQLTRDASQAVFTVKNTAAYEMDFTEEEILERFARGDKARTTEGSGLGLSIAKSFTLACGGFFDLAIDGDQFKVTITFPIHYGGRQTGQENDTISETAQPDPIMPVIPGEVPQEYPGPRLGKWNYP
ncbi:MAG: sensor histidine kinase [Massiliimalia sp.]